MPCLNILGWGKLGADFEKVLRVDFGQIPNFRYHYNPLLIYVCNSYRSQMDDV